ncbi:IS21 family transposase, partial [Desulfovirgula thermocuniculi]|uniref:IS21 family transposase n=1 Tax=Desulfovirgula thermocuniculi TaxID=348842 RepID=UPI0006877D8A
KEKGTAPVLLFREKELEKVHGVTAKMIGVKTWAMIHTYHQQGVPKSRIAEMLGIDRKTVSRALQQDSYPQERKKKPSILDPYKPYIEERLNKYDLTATRLFREIRNQGYTGSYETVKRYVATLREQRPRRAYIRFETGPGEQAQVDWSLFGRVVLNGREVLIWCFSMVLSYSRAMYIEFTTSCDLATFIRAHVNAFQYFGGVTLTVVYDNIKLVVLSRSEGAIRWNPEFLAFAHAYGFRPILCAPGNPEAKGKVERPFRYIRQDFFKGTEFTDLEDLNQKARRWLDEVANRRVHRTTGAVPFERLAEEKLRPLPPGEYQVNLSEKRLVSKDCLVSYDGNLYSVPFILAGREVEVKNNGRELLVFYQGELVAKHELAEGKGRMIRNPHHYEGMPKATYPYRMRSTRELFLGYFPQAEGFIAGLVKTKGPGAAYHLHRIIELLEIYPRETVAKALERASLYGAFDSRTVRNICAQDMHPPKEPELPPPPLPTKHLPTEQVYVAVRSLKEYEAALLGGGEDHA